MATCELRHKNDAFRGAIECESDREVPKWFQNQQTNHHCLARELLRVSSYERINTIIAHNRAIDEGWWARERV